MSAVATVPRIQSQFQPNNQLRKGQGRASNSLIQTHELQRVLFKRAHDPEATTKDAAIAAREWRELDEHRFRLKGKPLPTGGKPDLSPKQVKVTSATFTELPAKASRDTIQTVTETTPQAAYVTEVSTPQEKTSPESVEPKV